MGLSRPESSQGSHKQARCDNAAPLESKLRSPDNNAGAMRLAATLPRFMASAPQNATVNNHATVFGPISLTLSLYVRTREEVY